MQLLEVIAIADRTTQPGPHFSSWERKKSWKCLGRIAVVLRGDYADRNVCVGTQYFPAPIHTHRAGRVDRGKYGALWWCQQHSWSDFFYIECLSPRIIVVERVCALWRYMLWNPFILNTTLMIIYYAIKDYQFIDNFNSIKLQVLSLVDISQRSAKQ